MKFQRFSFTISVLILAGIFFSVWGYFIGGMPKAMEHAVVWFSASIVGVLLGVWLRRGTQVNK
jgi:hypothetical protein